MAARARHAYPAREGAVRRCIGATAVMLFITAGTAETQEADTPGRVTYDRWCAGCHGVEGLGDGPAAGYMLPRPRDFTSGLYQIKSTVAGSLPSDDDILRIIDEGMPGTAMPGWSESLTGQQRRDLVVYLKSFSPFFGSEPDPETLSTSGAPRVSPEGLEEGRAGYDQLECWRCHGQQGRGDGPSAFEQTDNDGFPIRPADLTRNWTFSGGGTVEDIYLRMMTGIEGTPMPSQADAVQSGVISEEQLWRVAQYVRSLSPESPPRVREVARAALVDGALPTTPGDSAWAVADEYYFPLVGQILARPRWFAPTVAGVWVRAVHNGEELALRVRWNDPSRSPDSRWDQWQDLVLATMEPNEGGPAELQALPDALTVQFPRAIPEGMERPYFLMGNDRQPVYLWRWDSESGAASEALASGIGQIEPLAADSQGLTSQGGWNEGEWVVVMSRPLAASSNDALTFETGRPIPISFYAWDGDNSESGTRGAISTWYYLHLDEPGSNTIYIVPVAATLLTFVLGLAFVMRAQRRPNSVRRDDSFQT
ncbi:MAG: c-type cytochrome [Gemmatimonadota bacterium]